LCLATGSADEVDPRAGYPETAAASATKEVLGVARLGVDESRGSVWRGGCRM
jgi:hypothetical protein